MEDRIPMTKRKSKSVHVKVVRDPAFEPQPMTTAEEARVREIAAASVAKARPRFHRRTLTYLWEHKVMSLVAVMGGVAALIASTQAVVEFVHPVTYQFVGDPPFAGRQEVADTFKDIQKSLKETLETAQGANQSAQQALQTSNENRLRRLRDDRIELKALVDQHPDDQVLQKLLDKTDTDIMKAVAEADKASK